MVKKHLIAPFLNNGTNTVPQWVRIKKSTAFDLALNPQTQDFDYICDESPTTELKSYKPSFNQSLTMYKGEPDYELVFERFYELKTGNEAKTEVLLVFFQEKKDGGSFKSWKSECIISVQNLNAVDSTITFDVLFGGTIKKGTVKIINEKPVFTEIEDDFVQFVFTIEKSSAPISGATVTVNGVSVVTADDGTATFTLKANEKYFYGAEKGSDSGYGTTGIVTPTNNALTVDIA